MFVWSLVDRGIALVLSSGAPASTLWATQVLLRVRS